MRNKTKKSKKVRKIVWQYVMFMIVIKVLRSNLPPPLNESKEQKQLQNVFDITLNV